MNEVRRGKGVARRWIYAALVPVSVFWLVEMTVATTHGMLPASILGLYGLVYATLGLTVAVLVASVNRLPPATRWEERRPNMALAGLAVVCLSVAYSTPGWVPSRYARGVSIAAVMLLTLFTVGYARWGGLRSAVARLSDRTVATCCFLALTGVWLAQLCLDAEIPSGGAGWYRLGAGLGLGLVLSAAASGHGRRAPSVAVLAVCILPFVINGLTHHQENRPLYLSEAGPVSRTSTPRPSIVVIILDTVRADYVDLSDPDGVTPNLYRLARDSTVFSHAWSTSSWTLPAHASLLTGTFASCHGAQRIGTVPVELGEINGEPLLARRIHADLPTLTELLLREGYETGAVVANYVYVAREWGFARGFRFFDDRRRMKKLQRRPFAEWLLKKAARRRLVHLLDKQYRPASEITNTAVEWMRRHQDGPVFLLINFMDAHEPYLPPPSLLERGPGEYRIRNQPKQDVLSGRRPLSSHEREQMQDLYAAEIASVDREMGRLLEAMRRHSLYDDSMVVVTSDHGESFGEHAGVVAHGYSLYEEEVRVPLIVKYPGTGRRGSHGAPVQLTDLMPTILAETGVEIPPTVQGRVLVDPTPRPIVAELRGSVENAELLGEKYGEDRWAVYDHVDLAKGILVSNGGAELYLLKEDPHETNDIAPEFPDRLAGLAATLEEVRRTCPVEMTSESRFQLDQRLLERLRSLGYMR